MSLMPHTKPLPLPTTRPANAPRRCVCAAGKNKTSSTCPGAKQAALIAGASLAVSSQVANAETVAAAEKIDYLDYFLNELTDGVQSLGQLSRFIGGLLETGFYGAKQGLEVAAPVVEDTLEVVKPVVVEGAKVISSAAQPTVQEGLQDAENFLSEQGVSVGALKEGAQTAGQLTNDAVELATPTIQSAFKYLTTTDPALLGFEALGIWILYVSAGPAFNLITDLARGYAGDASPPAALDAIVASGNAYLIDIRSQDEKESTGAPDLPGPASRRYVELEYAVTKSQQLRNRLRNPISIENEVTSMLISSLKQLKQDSTLFILDKTGSISPDIAKLLNGKGFKKCFVVKGGYNAWKDSKLLIKPSMSVTNVEVVPPILGTIFGTTDSNSTPKKIARRGRALPPGR